MPCLSMIVGATLNRHFDEDEVCLVLKFTLKSVVSGCALVGDPLQPTKFTERSINYVRSHNG